MTPRPVTMWAVVVKMNRCERILWPTISRLRSQARGAYTRWLGGLSAWNQVERELKQKSIRLARVVVAEEGGK